MYTDYDAKVTRSPQPDFHSGKHPGFITKTMHAPNSAPPAPVVEAPARRPLGKVMGLAALRKGARPKPRDRGSKQTAASWDWSRGPRRSEPHPLCQPYDSGIRRDCRVYSPHYDKRMSVLTALIIVPIIFALLGGFGPEIGPMMLNGVKAIEA